MTIRITVEAEARMQSGNVEPISASAEVGSWTEAEYELGRLERFVEHETKRIEGILPPDDEEEITPEEAEIRERNSHTH